MRFKILPGELERKEERTHLFKDLDSIYNEDTIDIFLKDPWELFNPLDPSPIQERYISEEVESYLFKQFDHISPNSHIAINIITDTTEYSEELIKEAFKRNFKIKAEEQILYNRKTRFNWLIKLFTGLFFLVIMLVLAQLCRLKANEHVFLSILSESFSIIGWVALWDPVSYLIYGHSENVRTLRRYMRLHRAIVKVVPKNKYSKSL